MAQAFAASDNSLVVFGIPPLRPATGYGYIKAARAGRSAGKKGILTVEKFCEKPAFAVALRFLRSGRYYWNSGMFVGSARIFLEEFKAHMPSLYRALNACGDLDGVYAAWKKLVAESFDYGILEKTGNVKMIVAGGMGWSDLGSWQAWDEVLAKDKDGNAFKGDVIGIGNQNTTIWAGNRLIAAVGMEDCIVVDTPDALLVVKKDQTEKVKQVVDALKASGRQEHYLHRTVKRPWGAYTVLDIGRGFKIKLVEVSPGKSLSLQKHLRRSEHWVVVEGTAKIVRGRRSYYVKENESTFIPIGLEHRIINPSGEPLKIVEVQSGHYLEEDDIVRLKDDFGRR
jgi:mannose-1-phosphate guanylyltransferase/mannose-6-phosphate isomerase